VSVIDDTPNGIWGPQKTAAIRALRDCHMSEVLGIKPMMAADRHPTLAVG